jgi:hypothetical protein
MQHRERRGTERTKVLGFLIAEKGQPLVVPVMK